MEIKNVIICGLGALGLTYANKLKDFCNLKILADEKRVLKYKEKPLLFNNIEVPLEYITPNCNWNADLILVTTKFCGLDSALQYMKNYVSEGTIILSLINGISSEEIIRKFYPQAAVLRSYFIGHSAIRNEENIYQDGVGKIVFENNSVLKKFFEKSRIDYEISENILYSQWIKLGVNIILNQLSAIYECDVGELKKRKDLVLLSKNLLQEVRDIAMACGIKNLDNYESEVFKAIELIANDGFTSMYQDIIANRKTEVEIFSGEILRLGSLYNIQTPFNFEIYNKIKLKEAKFL